MLLRNVCEFQQMFHSKFCSCFLKCTEFSKENRNLEKCSCCQLYFAVDSNQCMKRLKNKKMF